jgi:hypothetical protein
MAYCRGDKGAADYLDVAPATAKRMRKRGLLRFIRLPSGTILYRTDWIDADLEKFAVTGVDDQKRLDGIVADIMKEIK